MAMDGPNDGERVDQEFRIIELQGMAKELAGGQAESWESPACPPEVREQFWESVLEFENAPDTTLHDKFTEQGLELPPADSLSDEELTARLYDIINRMAEMHSYLYSTNHLSDRELYTKLCDDIFHDEYPDIPLCNGMNQHIDLLGSGSEEDTYLWMTYFADEESRHHWTEQFPDYQLPAHQDPPYDRDRFLPQPDYGKALPPEIELN